MATLPVIAAVILQVILPTQEPSNFDVITFERADFNKCLKIRDIIREEYKSRGIRASVTCKRKETAHD